MPLMKRLQLLPILVILVTPSLVTAEGELIKDQIVVQTPLQNYEQPTLRDYEECQANRESCLKVCAESESCKTECPLCPELFDKPLLVQGVNDTDYVPPAQVPFNTTNIIRLTNEINNIIKHDIQNRNEVNVQVQQNVSQVGGRFGLGYNEQGAACCYVVRRQRECEHKEHCRERSRQRVCGERCQARVMLAKRVVQCKAEQPTECHETIEYVPRRRRTKSSRDNRCRYLGNTWPYVSCEGQDESNNVRNKRSSCRKCMELPYGHVLRNGLPPQCMGCFQGYGAPMLPMWYMPYAPMVNPNFGYGFEQADQEQPEQEQEENPDSGWILETEKCLDAKGHMVDCPKGVEGSGDDKENEKPSPPAHLEQGEKKEDYDDYGVPAQRRRRRRHHQFTRSAYSRRQANSL